MLVDVSSIFALADLPEKEWELRTDYLEGSYFWYACLVLLEKLGGEQVSFDGQTMPGMTAPAWAYKKWQLAKREYRWRKWRKPSYLTLAEARRLGIMP